MAPFKLKFRMGNSRSTSQENENEQNNHQQQHQLNNGQQIGISNSFFNLNGSSTTTIDSEQNTDSCISYSNDRRALLQNQSSGDQQIGFINPTISQNYIETNSDIPLSPPPSYEHVLEENRLAEIDRQQEQQLNSTTASETCNSPLNDNISCRTMATTQSSQENLLECSGSCDPLYNPRIDDEDDQNNEEDDHHQCLSETNSMQNDGDESICGNDSRRNSYQQNTNDNSSQQQQQTNDNEINEYIDNKSSKELYKAVAKQWGIQCKMSDGCRCMDCQSNYFDCEYDDNEHQKSDGGLGAGTPMFISEVMQGSACTIL